ncbi:hypothetical protein ACMD2_07757 [Ananas comosus]|uniref:Uncharacterized protein n=1 Tax=Ananas comosus TaxID=4615 RepID=A0A199V9N3_ANACO|nr:hypothetical protein ACMD2_07757 [Ananas comosus]
MWPVRFKYGRQLRKIPIIISRPNLIAGDGDGGASSLPELRTCRSSDFGPGFLVVGGGRARAPWTTRALPVPRPDHPCQRPWCTGTLGVLESDGWVYSAHCSSDLRRGTGLGLPREQVDLLLGRLQPRRHIRNLLHFVLGARRRPAGPPAVRLRLHEPEQRLPVRPDHEQIQRPLNESMNYLGLQSLENEDFRRLLWKFFSTEDRVPDVMILNSGLHDGFYWRSVRAFAQGATRAAEFWAEVMRHVRQRGKAVPRIFYRTTIAAERVREGVVYNPSKMEAFNGVLLEKLKEKGLLSAGGGGGVIDEFDMTFPWHYDHRCSDGMHYGRAPAKAVWMDRQIGHHYFVDLMLAHVLLNAICSD